MQSRYSGWALRTSSEEFTISFNVRAGVVLLTPPVKNEVRTALPLSFGFLGFALVDVSVSALPFGCAASPGIFVVCFADGGSSWGGTAFLALVGVATVLRGLASPLGSLTAPVLVGSLSSFLGEVCCLAGAVSLTGDTSSIAFGVPALFGGRGVCLGVIGCLAGDSASLSGAIFRTAAGDPALSGPLAGFLGVVGGSAGDVSPALVGAVVVDAWGLTGSFGRIATPSAFLGDFAVFRGESGGLERKPPLGGLSGDTYWALLGDLPLFWGGEGVLGARSSSGGALAAAGAIRFFGSLGGGFVVACAVGGVWGRRLKPAIHSIYCSTWSFPAKISLTDSPPAISSVVQFLLHSMYSSTVGHAA